MSNVRKLVTPVVRQIQREFSTKVPKALVVSSKQLSHAFRQEEGALKKSVQSVKSPELEIKQFDEHKIEAEPVVDTLSSASEEGDDNELAFESLLLNSITWAINHVMAIPFFCVIAPIGYVIDTLEHAGSNLKPDPKKHGSHTLVWVRAEGEGDISEVVSKGLTERGIDFLEGKVSPDEFQKYLEFDQFAAKVGHGGCDGLHDSLRFVLNNHDLKSKNGFLVIVRRDDMQKKDKLFDVNLLEVYSERSYENEVILVGGITPQEIFAVIKYADLGHFLGGEFVTNMLINNPDLKNVKKHVCMDDLNLAEGAKPHPEQVAKVKETLATDTVRDGHKDFVDGIPVCAFKHTAEQLFSKHTTELLFFKKQGSTAAGGSTAPESSNDSSYRPS